MVMLCLYVILYSIWWLSVSKLRSDTENVRLADIVPSSIEKTLKLKTIEQRNFKKLEIKGNSKLRAVIVYDSKVFKRGCTYYEFTHEKEYITKDKELIFMNKVTNERHIH